MALECVNECPAVAGLAQSIQAMIRGVGLGDALARTVMFYPMIFGAKMPEAPKDIPHEVRQLIEMYKSTYDCPGPTVASGGRNSYKCANPSPPW